MYKNLVTTVANTVMEARVATSLISFALLWFSPTGRLA